MPASWFVKLINSVGLLNEAKSLHAQLQPVANALDRLQSDNATITDDCEEWLSLLRADALKLYLTTFMKRFRKQLLITTSPQICNIRSTKETFVWSWWRSCRQLLPKLHPEHPEVIAYVCIHSAFPASLIIRMCWPNVASCVVDVCQTANVKCHHLW